MQSLTLRILTFTETIYILALYSTRGSGRITNLNRGHCFQLFFHSRSQRQSHFRNVVIRSVELKAVGPNQSKVSNRLLGSSMHPSTKSCGVCHQRVKNNTTCFFQPIGISQEPQPDRFRAIRAWKNKPQRRERVLTLADEYCPSRNFLRTVDKSIGCLITSVYV